MDDGASPSAAERALAGQPRTRRPRSSRARASCSCATGSPCCSTRARSSRTRCSPTRRPSDLPADGVVTGVGRVDGRPVCVMANDPTVKAGSWGARTVEKIVRLTEYALRARAARLLAGRLGRRPHHRPGRAVPRPARRGPHLLQPGAAVGAGAADLLPVRPVGRRRRLHPGVLRRRDHGRGQRVDVPRLAPHGRDGDRRDRPRSRRWAAPACTPPCRAAATTSPSTTPTPSSRPRPYFSLPARDAGGTTPPVYEADAAGRDARPPTIVPAEEHAGLRHARRDRRRSSTPRASSRSSRCSPRS